jgi:hypothetical protein
MSNLNNDQAVEWVETIANNLASFRKKTRLNKAEKLEFIHNQYNTLYQLHRAIIGEILFKGVSKQFFGESNADIAPKHSNKNK